MTSNQIHIQLAKIERDVLVAYYLYQIVPNKKEFVPYRAQLKTPNDLYEFLLIDNQVTHQVKTSWVAEAISSLQLYINRIKMKLEPGLLMQDDEAQNWETIDHDYALWAANQQLAVHPENYINPTLRQHKTPLFKHLESDLSQGKINEDSVQSAILNYLSEFETLSNLQIISSYQNGLDPSNNKFYFIGCTRTKPYEYYWRTLDMYYKDAKGEPYPTAWSAWFKIGASLSQAVDHLVRVVFFNARLYLIWLEKQDKKDKEQKDVSTWAIRLVFKKLDDTWSAPQDYPLTLIAPALTTAGKLEEANLLATIDQSTGDEKNEKIIFGLYYRSTGQIATQRQLFHIDGCLDLSVVPKEHELEKYPFEHDSASGFEQKTHVVTTPIVFQQFAIGSCTVSYPGETESVDQREFRFLGELPVLNLRFTTAEGDIRTRITGNKFTIFLKFTLTMTYTYRRSPSISTKGIEREVKSSGIVSKQANFISQYFKLIAHLNSNQNIAAGENSSLSMSDQRHMVRDLTLTCTFHFEHQSTFGIKDLNSLLGLKSAKISLNAYLKEQLFHKDIHIAISFIHKDEAPKPFIQSREQAQFLLGLIDKNKPIRLNTLFGKDLVGRAGKNLNAVFHPTTQSLEEPAFKAEDPNVPMDFHGANGLYFWELFFHAPFLVSYRLTQEGRYKEAAQWLSYLFNLKTDYYWPLRPLSYAEQDPSAAYLGPTDPDALAMSNPIRYQKVIFLQLIQLLQLRGDAAYRRLTPDSLAAAKLDYILALRLLGPKPALPSEARDWENPSLSQATVMLTERRKVLRGDTRPQKNGQLSVPILSNLPVKGSPLLTTRLKGPFREPYNKELVARWDQLETRLMYLRHNLTLDGKPLTLPLFATPLNPRELQAQLASRSHQEESTLINPALNIPPYRFAVMLQKASMAVDYLIQLGQNLLTLLERKDNLEFEQQQYTQQAELLYFTTAMQEQSIKLAEKSREALIISLYSAKAREDHYRKLYDENISVDEQNALDSRQHGSNLHVSTSALRTAGAAMNLAPNTFGMAVGGSKWGALLEAAAWATQAAGDAMIQKGYTTEIKEQYRRRREDWEIQKKQAGFEVRQIEKQQEIEDLQIKIANTQIEQTRKQQEQYRISLDFFKTRVSNQDLYTWMRDRLRSLYRQAYDGVMSLCLSAQAAWQYEVSNFEEQFIQAANWDDGRHGLLAGEQLKLSLQRMDADYLLNQKRYLEIVKTVSLKQYLGSIWQKELETLQNTGKLSFVFNHRFYDCDYPGHYLRKLKTVSISLPALIGPYQDIRAVLTQISNNVTLKPKLDANDVSALYKGDYSSLSHIIKINLRATQQIALSTGINDSGLFTLNFDEERYLPFEGTGAASQWELQFPNPQHPQQQQLLTSLTDVIVQIRYTALNGGPAFSTVVEKALREFNADKSSI